MYGIGVEDSCGQYAMTYGPVKSQGLLLECNATYGGGHYSLQLGWH